MAYYSVAYVLPLRIPSPYRPYVRAVTIIGQFHGNRNPVLVVAPRSIPVLRIVSKRCAIELPPPRVPFKVIPYSPVITIRSSMH